MNQPRPKIPPKHCCSEVIPENSARSFSGPAALVKKALRDKLIPRGSSVLEVGAGCLRNSNFLQRKGYRVSVIELEAVARRYRREYSRFLEIGGKLLSSWPPPQSFDVVVSTFTLETICMKGERNEHLNRLVQSVRTGGHILIGVRGPKDVKTSVGKGRKCGDGYITPLKTFIKPFTVGEISNQLEIRGTRITKLYGGARQNAPKIIEIVAKKT